MLRSPFSPQGPQLPTDSFNSPAQGRSLAPTISWVSLRILTRPTSSSQERRLLIESPRIEMNVIIIAACIPTLRPVYLVLFNRPGANQFRANASPPHYTSYIRSSDSSAARMNHKSTSSNQAFQELASNASTRSINVGKDGVVAEDSVQIENREGGGREEGEGQWGHRIGTWVALSEVRRDAER